MCVQCIFTIYILPLFTTDRFGKCLHSLLNCPKLWSFQISRFFQMYQSSNLPLNWENSDSMSSPFQLGCHLFLPWLLEDHCGVAALYGFCRSIKLGSFGTWLWGGSNWAPGKVPMLVWVNIHINPTHGCDAISDDSRSNCHVAQSCTLPSHGLWHNGVEQSHPKHVHSISQTKVTMGKKAKQLFYIIFGANLLNNNSNLHIKYVYIYTYAQMCVQIFIFSLDTHWELSREDVYNCSWVRTPTSGERWPCSSYQDKWNTSKPLNIYKSNSFSWQG